MSLTDRLTDTNRDPDPEDLLASSLGVIFPDTVANQHGDASNALLYTSPHLPRKLRIELADPPRGDDRLLFGHYLWNASLLAAELVESGALAETASREGAVSGEANDAEGRHAGDVDGEARATGGAKKLRPPDHAFDVKGKSVVELGSGTALPSTMAALFGAAEVVVTDYPNPSLLATLRANVARNITKEMSPSGYVPPKVEILAHSWGKLEGLEEKKGAFDIVIAADCLWMPWQHQNLLSSTSHLLKRSPSARAWIIAGFHTGRRNMRGFFYPSFLSSAGLETEYLYEVECTGAERDWVWERDGEDLRRWCVVGLLKWIDP